MNNWTKEYFLLIWLGSGFLTGIVAAVFYVAINWRHYLKFRRKKVKEWLPIALGMVVMLTPFGLTVVGLVPFYLMSLLISQWAEDDDRGDDGGDGYSPDPMPRPSDKLNPKEIIEDVIRNVQKRLVRK